MTEEDILLLGIFGALCVIIWVLDDIRTLLKK